MLVRPCVQNVPGKIDEVRPSGYSLHPQESGPEVVQGPGGVTSSPTLLGPVLVWSQQNYLKFLLIVRFSKFSDGCCPRRNRTFRSEPFRSEPFWSGRFRSGGFGLGTFRSRRFCTQTTPCICLFKYRQAKCHASWCYTNSFLRSHDCD